VNYAKKILVANLHKNYAPRQKIATLREKAKFVQKLRPARSRFSSGTVCSRLFTHNEYNLNIV